MTNEEQKLEKLGLAKRASKQLTKKISQLYEIRALNYVSTRYREVLLKSLTDRYGELDKEKVEQTLLSEIKELSEEVNKEMVRQ